MFILFVAAATGVILISHIGPFAFLLDVLPSTPSRWTMPSEEEELSVYFTYDDGQNLTATPALFVLLEATARIERLAVSPSRGLAERPDVRGASAHRLHVDRVGVGWDWDWFRVPDPDRLICRFVDRLSAGDIIVTHDGHHENPSAERRKDMPSMRRPVSSRDYARRVLPSG